MTSHVPPVHDLDGPVVVLGARVCAWLVRRLDLDSVRTAVRGIDPEVDAALMAISVASLAWRTRNGCAPATEMAHRPQPDASSELTPSEAAARVGVSPQAIRKACATGRLPARRIGGRWVIAADDFELWKTRR
jgi:excisionase family DNA binding protein